MQDLIKKINLGNDDSYWTELQLNRTKALNALSQEMCEIIYNELVQIENDPNCVGLLLTSNSEKAFCAGGDVKQVVIDLKESRSNAARSYFQTEYKMDLKIHQLSKPSIVWMNGYVFGGGLGLAFGNDIRIVEPTTSISMPEAKIGFFPDVGASLFLGRMPWPIGLFAAWSSYRFSAGDAIQYGLADYTISNNSKIDFREFLSVQKPLTKIELLNSIKTWCLERNVQTQSELYESYSNHLMRLEKGSDAEDTLLFFNKLTESTSESFKEFIEPWIDEIKKSSPCSRAMAFAQMKWALSLKSNKKTLTIVEALNAELWLAEFAGRQKDFSEGVDSMLISKSQNPQWQNKKMSDYKIESLISGLEENKTNQAFKT
jgi:enoyl-CoA hydratase/carnithine racemase